MGPPQLWLLLLLSSGAWTQDDGSENTNPFCSRDTTRFKHLRKYVYNYEAETTSGVTGTADTRSGSKITCKVELEVPQLCHFNLRTSQCSLREVAGINPEGEALLKKSKSSDDFAMAMSKYELKFKIKDQNKVQLYAEDDEPMHILNIKRGIISALIVPIETESEAQTLTMDTVYGKCESEIKNRKNGAATAGEIEIKRDLKSCDNFIPIRDFVSPIALIKGLNAPLSTLISSNQHCQYTIDPKKRHVSGVVCSEKHLFLPSSYKNQYGMMATVKQVLRIEDTPRINNREMEVYGLQKRQLSLEGVKTKSSKHGDAVLKVLQELQRLSVTQQNQKRASLFYRFVTGLRGLHNETLGPLVPKLMETSSSITIQALSQCGTLECYGALLQILRTSNVDPLIADAITYSLGLLSSPSTRMIQELLNMAQYQQSRATFYALSHAVNRFYNEIGPLKKEINDVANFMISLIGNECSNEDELTYLTLKAIGNMGNVLDENNANLKNSVKTCIRSNAASPEVQKAAIQALRKMTINDEDRGLLVKVFQEASSPVDKRLAAYLMLMRNPSTSDISKVIKTLQRDKNEQVKSFIASHIANILDSENPYIELIRNKVQEAINRDQLPTARHFQKFSRNYQIFKSLSIPWENPVMGQLEGNLIFEPESYVPRESMLKTTLEVVGMRAMDLFEIGLDGKNFEPTLDAMFGPKGFFPDSATKALYWIDGKVPDQVSQVLFDYFGYTKDGKQDQDVMKGVMLNFEKLIKEIVNKDSPEAKAYLRILGEELGYLKLSDIKLVGNLIMRSLRTLETGLEKITQAVSKGTENDLFAHYIFMDNEFELPTGAGLQLQFALSGVATPGMKAGVKISQRNMKAELIAKPSMAVEFVTHLGVNIPEFARSGVQMNTNMYHESGIEAHVGVRAGQLKLTIPAPKSPTKLFSLSNVLHLVTPTRIEVIPPLIENRESQTSCTRFFAGLNMCVRVEYSNASSTEAAPYYPLTGETRYEVEIQPTGEVKEYTASANYELKREEEDLVDTMKFIAQAEGIKKSEATLTLRYNRGKHIFTSDLQIPSFDIDFGTNLRITDSSSEQRKAYAFILDINNKKIPEVTLTGRIGYQAGRESSIEASISIPRLQTQAKTDVSLLRQSTGIIFQIDSSATAHGSSISERIVLRYDNEKIEVQWNSGTSAALKKMSGKLPIDLDEYSKALQRQTSELLDHKVANTDMTFRHIISHFITATNTWLHQASSDVPYAQQLKDKLSGLQDLNFQIMNLITIPEELFLRSDGQIKYIWNKEKTVFTIPVPFGGRSSYDMRVPKTVRTPPLVMESLGVSMPSQEYRIPPFTIPESYTLQVPLLGTFEISSNIYSNYYNWSGSYSLANTTSDAYSLKTSYFMKADSVLDLLSYSTQGQGEAKYDKNVFTIDYENLLQHSLLNSNFKISKLDIIEPSRISRYRITAGASSPLGAKFSLSYGGDAKFSNMLLTANENLESQLDVASAFAKVTYTDTGTYDLNNNAIAGESNLKFDSSFLQATNQLTKRFTNEVWAVTSISNVQNGFLTNTASLKYQDSRLMLSSETAGKHRDYTAFNKFDLTLQRQGASLSSEYRASCTQGQGYALISGSVNNRGAELISHMLARGERNKAEHKSTLSINQDGLASSATTTLQFNPLTLENEMNARIAISGASMKINTNGRFGKHHAKFDWDGKASLKEIGIASVYQGSISDVDSKNTLNFRVNKGGLKLSNSLIGSYKEMKLEHTHDLNMVGLTLTYTSTLDHTISLDKSHKHRLEMQLKPYSLTANVNSDLKYASANANNKAQLQLELLKVNLDGNVKAAYGGDEVKHSYTFTYSDLAAHLKTDTVASIQGAALMHRVNVDVAGLSSSVAINSNCNSKFLTFSNEMRSVVAPFTITVDMHTNGDGRLMVFGEQSGRLYSKFLLKAEPLAFTFSHFYKGSTDHNLNSGKRYNTLLDNKVVVIFTPSEQSSTWTMKSQLNNHAYTQDLNIFNNAEKIGMELSGQTLADLSVLDFPINIPFTTTRRINLIDTFDLRENLAHPQEFGLSLSVKYDKNEDVHIINLPFLETLPVHYERYRQSILTALKSIQKNLRSINMDQFMRKYKATLDKLPQQINSYINSIDFENRMTILKDKWETFLKDYSVTVDDLKHALDSASSSLGEALFQLETFLTNADNYIRENYDLKATIVQLIEQIIEKLKVIDQQFKISTQIIDTIQQLQSAISQYDPSQIGSSAAAWVQNIDTEYKIKAQLQEKLDQLKRQIQSIDAQHIAESLKQQVEAIDIKILLEKLKMSLPLQKMKDYIEQIQTLILNFLEDYEVFEKILVFQTKLHELLVNYKVDQQVNVLIEKFIEFSNQQRIKETIQKITLSLRKIDVKSFFNQVLKFIDDAVQQLQTVDYKNLVDKVNDFLDDLIKKLRSFDYNKFVDETNIKIQEARQKINDEIRALELPQKVEAAKRYVRDVSHVVSQYIEELKDSRFAVIVNWFNLLSSTITDELKVKVCDYLKDARDRIYQMDIAMECQRYLERASQLYNTIITYLADQWYIASKKITDLAEKYNVKNMADSLNQFVETGFKVPEISTGVINIPSFEISLRALREATFQTPDFIIPLTDLRVPSYQVNFKKLKEITIPTRFETPEFTILNTYKIPSYIIDLNEIKLQIVKTIDQILTSDFRLPPADAYFQDLRMQDMSFSDFSFPEMDLPDLQIPEFIIPKLNLNDFQFPDVQIPEFKLPRIPHSVTAPTFGKLSGAFRVASPFFTLTTNAGLQNVTAFDHSPEFMASISAISTSKINFLAFTITADTHLLAPEMQRLILRDNFKFSHVYLKADHAGEIIFSRTSIDGNAETTANLRTTRNALDLHNKLTLNLQKKISMESKTTYTHKLNIPVALFTSQAELSNEIKTVLEAGRISLTSIGKGDWKWATYDYSDEGTHESSVSFTVGGSVAALVAENKITDKYLKVNQRLAYEYNLPSFAKLQIESTVESPQLGHSTINIQGTGNLAEMKMKVTGTQNAKMNGRISGTLNNDVAFLVQPFEVSASTNNDANIKISFLPKMTGKIEFLNNYGLMLSPSTQQISWVAEGRFNQYRYAHNMSASNNEDSIGAFLSMNGDANLDFLTKPISLPELAVPYVGIQTPTVQEYCLWEETGLKNLLKTPKQSFDLNLKAQYKKNKYMHSFQIPLDGVHRAINDYIVFFNKHFEKGRDNALAFLTESYNQAKTNFDIYKVDTSASQIPQIFRIPGYTIPVVNIEVSPFTAELPAFGYIIPKEMSTPSFTVPLVGFSVPSYTLVLPSLELPVLHVPQGLQTLKLPSYRTYAPSNRIYIPALGNITYEFSFKSSVITLNTNAGFFNQSDIVAHLSSSSTSVIDALQYKLDGTTSLTRKRSLKLATALSLNHKFIEGNHDSTISLTKRNIEASVITTAKINMPGLKVNFGQELKGNTKSKPIITSAINLNYDLDTGVANAKGEVAHKVTVESIISYISVDTSTNGFINGNVYKEIPFSGKLVHEANAYLNAKGGRASFQLETNSNVDEMWNFGMKENVAFEASSQRLYALWDHNAENKLFPHLIVSTKGNQNCKVTLELGSTGMSVIGQIQAIQYNNIIGEASANQAFLMTISNENQKMSWTSENQIYSLFLGHDLLLTNNNTVAQFTMSGSLGGHMDFLRHRLPIYDRSLWDILKLDLTTSGGRQYLNVATGIVYTKNEDGYFIPINVNRLTNLQIPSYTIDLRQITVPETLATMPFDISLPSMPKIQFPQLAILTSYVDSEDYKIPSFELTVPEYLLRVSEFTLPKTLSFGDMTVDFNAIANKIADFDLPTITIPEQQIEIPAFKVFLPAGIYIPKFGALAGSLAIASPIYSTTWKMDFKNKKNSFEHSIDFTAISPLQFLEYDLDAVTTCLYQDNFLKASVQSTFAHRDLSAEYKEILIAQGRRILEHKASLDITSPTFTDVQVRYQGSDSKVAASVSSSSAGTLGLLIDLDSDVFRSKIFYRSQSNPENDVDVLKSEISFKNPELIQLKANWETDGAMDLLKGFKERVPKMTSTLYNAVDKYHKEHTGMEMHAVALKLNDNLKRSIDSAYENTLNDISELQQQLHVVTDQATGKYETMRKKAKKLYYDAADQANQIDYEQIRAKFFDAAMQTIKEYNKRIKHLIDSTIEFLKVSRFQVPGVDGKHTGEELFVMATEKLRRAVDVGITKVQEYFEAFIAFINELEVKIPASRQIIKGSAILDEIKGFLNHVRNKVGGFFVGLLEIDFAQHLRDLKEVIQQVFQKVEELVRNLQAQNYEYISLQAKQLFTEALQGVKSLAEDRKYLNPRIENFIQNIVETCYNKGEELLQSMKDLREEYFDPSIVGWSVKYYEVEEKVLAWLKSLINALREWHKKYVSDSADLIVRLADQAQEFVDNHEKITEFSRSAHDKILYWSQTAKKSAAEQNIQVKEKLQEAYEHLSYERFITNTKKLIDLVIENYAAFFQDLQQLLHQFEEAAADTLRPYIMVRQGELRIDIPKPFDMSSVNSFYQPPQLREDDLHKK
ncbi:apolipoprotein B-100 [Anolis carolinensis]|uniref:apolipoprotein B-100 n=1 Tax=Anolis carolinensis TaxID=28377 RepID=UPI002F2B248F